MHVAPKENGGIGRHMIVHDQITKSKIYVEHDREKGSMIPS